ncbi:MULTISPECIES: DUF2278 family protein [unclassified Streptomyces]|uniref:DUF2278 family protein n=1 Tax=unclassified Streptomyces TaxID=2593676 RepID=UPI0005F97A38|nr:MULTISPECIES: DUF2278 family protein [unclassified Streptomyces]KJY28025.1 hypothetical protein VR45_33500 [Streptomyces sp. NRRL S-495]KOV17622.1 hypothetical protein ADK60_27115 [Streptomyces sp. XY431]
MPLPLYGVAVGTFQDFSRDPSHDFGQWYHGHLTLTTPTGTFEAALDVDAPGSVGVSYRLVDGLHRSDLGSLPQLPDGFQRLESSSTSGALDYARSPLLRDPDWLRALRGLVLRVVSLLQKQPVGAPAFGPTVADRLVALLHRLPNRPVAVYPWVASNGDNALDVLEPLLRSADRIYVFGQRFTTGLGVHDVHLNQGDPLGSQWYDTDGIWQDGAVVCEFADGRVVVWQIRFNTQSLNTDGAGHPL